MSAPARKLPDGAQRHEGVSGHDCPSLRRHEARPRNPGRPTPPLEAASGRLARRASASTTCGRMGRPGRPALSSGPLLGPLVACDHGHRGGHLVARVGLVPDEVLVAALSSPGLLSQGRMIAGLGHRRPPEPAENEAFGVPFELGRPGGALVARSAAAVRDRASRSGSAAGLPRTIELARRLSRWPSTSGRRDALRVAELTSRRDGGDLGRPGRRRRSVEATARLAVLGRPGPPGRCAPGPTPSRWWRRRPSRCGPRAEPAAARTGALG